MNTNTVCIAEDVAAYILTKINPISRMKLHGLLFYCQAVHLFMLDELLFNNHIQAWAGGMVVVDIFYNHGKWEYQQGDFNGDISKLSENSLYVIDLTIKGRGYLTNDQLTDKIHQTNVWKETREGLSITERGYREVDLLKYYSCEGIENYVEKYRPKI
jgi:uncharacterized phage-associated protein